MSSHFSMFALFPEQLFGEYHPSFFLYPSHNFWTLRGWVLYKGKGKSLALFFNMQLSNESFWCFCKKWSGYDCVNFYLQLLFFCIGLYVCSCCRTMLVLLLRSGMEIGSGECYSFCSELFDDPGSFALSYEF